MNEPNKMGGDEFGSRHCPSEYPEWVCGDCGEKYGRRLPKLATWHDGDCEICGFTNAVTEPRDFGHLKEGWHLMALEAMALQVVKMASIGDQHFIACLSGDVDATKRLRWAIVSLAQVLRTAF